MPKTFLNLPHGLEVLIIKAAVDPDFKTLLLERRAGAAGEIGLTLTPTEAAMLAAIPAATLEATIAQTQVLPETRRVFLGKVAAAMLAALGVGTGITGCTHPLATQGISPDLPRKTDQLAETVEDYHNQTQSALCELRQDQEATMDELKKKTETLARQLNQNQMELEELQKQLKEQFGTLGVRPDRPRLEPQARVKATPSSSPGAAPLKTAQPATTATEEMIDLRTIVKFPKPLFSAGIQPHISDPPDDALRDGWDVSPNSKRK